MLIVVNRLFHTADQSGTWESETIVNGYLILADENESSRIPLDRFSSGQEECVSEVQAHPEYQVLLYDMFYYYI